MKRIKAKPAKTSAKINSLLRPTPPEGTPAVERVLVVYGEGNQNASIYYEPPATKPAVRP